MSSLEPGFRIAPHASPSDPSIALLMARNQTSSQIMNLLSLASQKTEGTTNTKSHVDLESTDVLKTDYFVLVPHRKSGRAVKKLSDRGEETSYSWWRGLLNMFVYEHRDEQIVHDICVDGEMITVEDGNAVWVKSLKDVDLFSVIV